VSWLLKLWRTLPEPFQVSILKTVQRNKPLYRLLLFRHVDAKDRAAGIQSGLPPAELRYRVSSTPDAQDFVRVGKTCASDIQFALRKVGRELTSFTRILDFGCGCGRTLTHLRDLAPSAQIHGTDIDSKAIEWCSKYLPFATFKLNKQEPPLDYPADTFDFIYAISVFTHLNRDHEFRWLDELRRVATPGGILVITVNGSVSDQGFVFERSYEKGLFPDWYQNSYHSKEYVFTNFGKYFEVLDYSPQSLNAHQDVVVLQKRR
jgi:SAM-dependent methyltransferase